MLMYKEKMNKPVQPVYILDQLIDYVYELPTVTMKRLDLQVAIGQTKMNQQRDSLHALR